jgi:DNA-binding transcriptional MerR regulator
MEPSRRKAELPPIPAKRYFTIGEVSDLCGVKPHVLRYWEHHEVLLIRRIRELLYEEGFTISGARNRLDNNSISQPEDRAEGPSRNGRAAASAVGAGVDLSAIKRELRDIILTLGA